MAINMDDLYNGLNEYKDVLERHISELRGDFDDLSKQWLALSQVYEGQAADQFRTEWNRQSEAFEAYIAAADRILPVLRDRIIALGKARDISETL